MQIGIIGLGKMGLGLSRNLIRNGHKVIGYDINPDNAKSAAQHQVEVVNDLKGLICKLPDKKILFLMVPAGKVIDEILDPLVSLLKKGDVIVDCGNSNYKDSIRRYQKLKEYEIGFLDCGTSGGPSGALNGACTMIGGDREIYQELHQIFEEISIPGGSLYVGNSGSGHFVKMVHNGIEYGMMQSIAEGYEIMHRSGYNIDLEKVSLLFNNGSVIRSWLIELMSNIMREDQSLESIRGVMHSSGEAKWTVETALDLEVPAPVIALSLMMRNRSLKEDTYSGKVIAALRNQFGGHEVIKSD